MSSKTLVWFAVVVGPDTDFPVPVVDVDDTMTGTVDEADGATACVTSVTSPFDAFGGNEDEAVLFGVCLTWSSLLGNLDKEILGSVFLLAIVFFLDTAAISIWDAIDSTSTDGRNLLKDR